MYNRVMEAKGKVISSLEAQKENQVKMNMTHRWWGTHSLLNTQGFRQEFQQSERLVPLLRYTWHSGKAALLASW